MKPDTSGVEAYASTMARLTADGPMVIAQLGQSLDGRIATPTGESRDINGPAALGHLHRLRASVDAVIVGAGTVAADNPRLTVRLCSGKSPVRVVVDPSGRGAPGGLWLAQDGVRRIAISTAAPPPGCDEHIALGPDPVAIVAALRRRGFGRLLVEGGARIVSAFLDAGVLDRLHVLVAPMIIGSGRNGLDLAPLARLADARRPGVAISVFEGGDVLFDCDLRRPY